MPLPASSVAKWLHDNEVSCISPHVGLVLLKQMRDLQGRSDIPEGIDLYRRALSYVCEVAACQQGLTIKKLEELVAGGASADVQG